MPVTGFVLVCVLCTTVAVSWVARLIEPGLPWAVAIALGAIVAPPDASAAAAVLVVLEGESLLNDATALLVYRVAVGAAMGGAVGGWQVLPMLLLTCGGGALLGVAMARLWFWLNPNRQDIAIAVLIQFLGTFAVWLLAERLGVSAIITMVAYAMTIARFAPARMGGRARIASYAVWEVAVFVLNVLAFILIGLQLRGILQRLDGGGWADAGFAAAACGVVILVRIAWVMGYTGVVRALRRQGERPGWQGSAVVSWCGMRGIVTLAAALALPEGFLYRDLILLTVFAVTVMTLVVQGLSLRFLLERLAVPDDGTVAREVALARRATTEAAIAALDGAAPEAAAKLLRRDYAARLVQAAGGGEDLAGLQRQAVAAQRRQLLLLRSQGRIGDDAFHQLEEEIDLLDLTADARIQDLRAPEAPA